MADNSSLSLSLSTPTLTEDKTWKNKLYICDNLKVLNGLNSESVDLFDIDHIIPKSVGGGDYLENYQLLCRTCNTTKGARPMAFLLQRIDLIRKLRREVEY